MSTRCPGRLSGFRATAAAFPLEPRTAAAPAPGLGAGLFDVLARRRSVREYGPPPLDLDDLGALLWAAAGVTARQSGFALRTAPSAGGLFPIEHYVIANSVTGLAPGVYHYAVLDRALELLRGGYILLDAGHIAENVALAAVALGLGSCQIAAFFDDEAAALLGVDEHEEPVVYMTTVGRPAE